MSIILFSSSAFSLASRYSGINHWGLPVPERFLGWFGPYLVFSYGLVIIRLIFVLLKIFELSQVVFQVRCPQVSAYGHIPVV